MAHLLLFPARMARLAASQVVSFSRVAADVAATESIESLRGRCWAAEHAARTAAAEASQARAELLRIRQTCQAMLDATALEVLELKRELQARDRAALKQRSSPATPRTEDEIPFDEIEAALAASPACS